MWFSFIDLTMKLKKLYKKKEPKRFGFTRRGEKKAKNKKDNNKSKLKIKTAMLFLTLLRILK